MIPLQANIGRYAGRPSSVFGALDEDTGILVVATVADAGPRHPGCILIASDPREDRDALFGDADLLAGIRAYLEHRQRPAPDGQGTCLRFGPRAIRADPAAAIEQDGLDPNGPRYRVSADATNAQIGTLALCLQASRYVAMADTVAMAESLTQILMRGGVITV